MFLPKCYQKHLHFDEDIICLEDEEIFVDMDAKQHICENHPKLAISIDYRNRDIWRNVKNIQK